MDAITICSDFGVRLKVEKVYMNIQCVKNFKCKFLYDFTFLSSLDSVVFIRKLDMLKIFKMIV